MGFPNKIRYRDVRVADNLDDQSTASQIVLADPSSVTQEDLQRYLLSQVKRIIWGDNPGNWYLDFREAGIPSLASSVRKTGIRLAGSLNGVNRVFQTPDKFMHLNGVSIDVFHNGRRLIEAVSPDPGSGDFYVSESGGSGTGFDQINLLTFTPVAGRSILVADYQGT